ncbi:MAG: radical SAM protein [Verrucomicrobia bacterium]|nr:radical SAM protein [Verrucomicrobiota bacterium]MCF7709307.1 radical SAM protein [Verrucomicrobiota bacterium]
MDPVLPQHTPQEQIRTPPESRASEPIPKPHKNPFKLTLDVLKHGGPGYLQFAITNICNAKCEFCGFAAHKLDAAQRHSVSLAEAKDAIRICADNNIGYLLFVGGEPLVHKDLLEMVRFCAVNGIEPMVCTNGALWNDRNMKEFANAGLCSVIMSIDSEKPDVHDKHRGLPGACEKIRYANRFFANAGIQSTASVTISKLIKDYERLAEFILELGFESCTFSYPLNTLDSSYLSFSESDLVTFTTDELIEEFDKIKRLKKSTPLKIINPTESLNEMQRHLRGERELFGCLGGFKYFYLDWTLNLYRCHYWHKPMCSIYDFTPDKLIRDGCTKCMIDCYRDPSVMQFIAVNLSDTVHHLQKLRLRRALKSVFDTRNLTSLKAVWEQRDWIRKKP